MVYQTLEPSSLASLGVKAPSFTGAAASFSDVASFLWGFSFFLIIAAASIRYAVSGGLRMQASESSIGKSKEIFKQVTIGLVCSFGLFLLFLTLNAKMVSGDITGLGELGVGGVGVNTTASKSNTTPPNTSTNSSYTARKASHDATVALLAPSGIHTNHNDAACTEAQFGQTNPSCTSLAYLPQETIQMVLKVNGDCHCTVVITGGTEPGHVSHGENKRPVDLRINNSQDASDPLYAYIKSIATPGIATPGCYMNYKYTTFTFCDEKPPSNAASTWAPHFHVY